MTADAKGRLSKHLPFFRVNFDTVHLPQIEAWRTAFSSDNPPESAKFDDRLEDLIREVDFSKPFNSALSDSIRLQFLVKSRPKADVDADLIIQGELGELDSNQPGGE